VPDLDVDLTRVLVCAGIAFIAGIVDAMAGGGGIFTLPAILSVPGFTVPMAAGTSKIVGTAGSGTATLRFLVHGRIDRTVAGLGALCALAGGAAGAFTLARLGRINEPALKAVFGALLVIAALYMFWKPQVGSTSAYAGPGPRTLVVTAASGLVIGFYDGFFGPGTGSFLVFVMVRFLRFDFVVGTGNAKAMNFGSNIGSVATFIGKGLVVWPLAIPMAVAGAAGSWVGSTLAIRQGARFVRWAFLAAAVAIAVRMAIALAAAN
jgi:hypothetical protein